MVEFRSLDKKQSTSCAKNLKNKSEHIRDIAWLIAVRRLPVRILVRWCCYLKTTKCLMPGWEEDENLEQFLLNCYRSREIWGGKNRF